MKAISLFSALIFSMSAIAQTSLSPLSSFKTVVNESGKKVQTSDNATLLNYYKTIHKPKDSDLIIKNLMGTLKSGDNVTFHVMEFEKVRSNELKNLSKVESELEKQFFKHLNTGTRAEVKLLSDAYTEASKDVDTLTNVKIIDVKKLNSILSEKGLSDEVFKSKLQEFLKNEFKDGKRVIGMTIESEAKAQSFKRLGIASTLTGLVTTASAISYLKVGSKSRARLDSSDRSVIEKISSPREKSPQSYKAKNL